MNSDLLRVLRAVASLGPEGGFVIRRPQHSKLDVFGLIETTGNRARVTGEGLDMLARFEVIP